MTSRVALPSRSVLRRVRTPALLVTALIACAPAHAATTIVVDAAPGSASTSPGPLNPIGPVALFEGSDEEHGTEPWRTDGTAAGTGLVKDLYPGTSSSGMYEPVTMNGVLYFASTDGVFEPGSGFELWRSDGTDPGTYRVKDIHPGQGSSMGSGTSFDPLGRSHPTVVGSVLYFAATGDPGSKDLWRSDGTDAGTYGVWETPSGDELLDLAEMDGELYFATEDGLWHTDGTEAGTEKIFHAVGGSGVSNLVTVGEKLFFNGSGASDAGLFVTDGTVSGTDHLAPVFAESGAAVGAQLFFAADDGTNGKELWHSDGTPAGTAMVTDINPGPSGSVPSGLTAVGDHVYFSASTGEGTIPPDVEPWRSDGTEGGTAKVKDISSDFIGSLPSGFVEYGGRVYFFASDAGARDLWRTDGTSGGTERVTSGLRLDSDVATPFAGRLFFSASTPACGSELWSTDGEPPVADPGCTTSPGGGGDPNPPGGDVPRPGAGGCSDPRGCPTSDDEDEVAEMRFAGRASRRARVARNGRFALAAPRLRCSEGPANCVVTTTVTTAVARTAATRSARVGGSRFTVRRGRSGKISSKLNAKGRRMLKQRKRLKVTLAVVARRGGERVKRKLTVTLLPARR